MRARRAVLLLLVATGCGGGSPAGDGGPGDGGDGDGDGIDGAPADAAAPDAIPVEPLLRVAFDGAPLGAYTREALDAEWLWVDWASPERASIVEGADAYAGRSLRILYPAGGVGPGEGGAQWMITLPAPYQELYCAYRVRFAPGFDFVLGGKLPGLGGGAVNTGGSKPDGTDGWSARMMWRTAGAAVQYVYHPDQPTQYGEDFPWTIGSQVQFEPGTYHRVEHRIVMNTPGEHDGVVQGWFDGELALDRADVRFRDVDTLAIDAFYFSTFFGGSDPTWAPPADTYVYFDDFVISTAPIAH